MSRLVINMRDSRPLWSIPAWGVAEIRRAAPPRFEVLEVGAVADGRGDGGAASPEAVEAVRGAEIHLGFGFPRALFESARAGRALRWVHSGSAGVGGSLSPEMVESPILLTNSRGIHAEPMADTILAMVLHFARGLDYAVRSQHRHEWRKDPFDSRETHVRELAGSTVGVAGFGGIGRAVAKRALALGMHVLGWRRRADAELKDVEVLTGESGLRRILSASDYLVIALPRTPATERLLNEDRIALLRPGSVIINVGRGELVDERALVDALATGRIRGAGLDVFVREPLPADSPFWSLPNVLITPHVSATTDRFWRRQIDLIVENLRRYDAGEALLNLVDKRAGY